MRSLQHIGARNLLRDMIDLLEKPLEYSVKTMAYKFHVYVLMCKALKVDENSVGGSSIEYNFPSHD